MTNFHVEAGHDTFNNVAILKGCSFSSSSTKFHMVKIVYDPGKVLEKQFKHSHEKNNKH